MANKVGFTVDVGAVLNASNIPKELDRINAQLSKSNSTKIKFKLDTGQITTAIKEINEFNTAVGKIKQVRIYDPVSGAEFKNDLTNINEGLKVVTTETNKWTNSLGQLVTQVRTVDDYGNVLIEETKNYINALGQEVEEVRLLDENLNQLSNTTTNISNITREFTTSTSSAFGQITDTVNGVTNTYEGLITTTTKVGTNGEYLRTVVSKYKNEVGQLVIKTEQLNEANQQVASTERVVSNAISNTNAQVKTLGNNFANALSQLTKFYLASIPLRTITKVISETVEAVKDFDAAITEMGKVTDYSGEKLKSYAEDLGKLGKEVARTRAEMTEAATGWLKAGYSEEDAAKLAKYSSLLQNTADEQLSAADATSILVSQLKAYHMEADEAIKITDIINKVSAEQAVSSGDIAKGLQQASSSMATFGNSIEQTTALLTGGTTIFQGQSQRVARALNTIAIRVTKNKDALAKYDITVERADGSLRSTYEILEDLKPKWDEMTDAERTALGATLAG